MQQPAGERPLAAPDKPVSIETAAPVATSDPDPADASTEDVVSSPPPTGDPNAGRAPTVANTSMQQAIAEVGSTSADQSVSIKEAASLEPTDAPAIGRDVADESVEPGPSGSVVPEVTRIHDTAQDILPDPKAPKASRKRAAAAANGHPPSRQSGRRRG